MKQEWKKMVTALQDKKATNVVVLDVRGVCTFTDFIIICTGMSDRQIKAMAEHVIENFGKPFGVEGVEHGRWVLLDYYDVVIHIFQDDVREYYDLENMWFEAKKVLG